MHPWDVMQQRRERGRARWPWREKKRFGRRENDNAPPDALQQRGDREITPPWDAL